jgi:hypothetical protein
LEPDEAVQLCMSLRYCGAYLYYAVTETQDEQVGAASTIKYWMMTGTVKQQAVAETSMCSIVSTKLTGIEETV